MTNDIEPLRSYLVHLGLDPKIAEIYLALQAYGPQSMSELARNSGVERIQIYRLLDELKRSGLVEIEIQYKRSVLHAAPVTTLQVLLAKREQELKDLQQEYVALTTTLGMQSMESATARVQFYEGMDGIKQMLWNQTRGGSENLAILYDNMQNKTNLIFFERWVRKCNEQGIRFRGIIGDHFIHTQQDWYAKHSNERLENWESRYVAESVFPISYSIVTYDDVVAHYNWNDERMFGIEIHNPVVARVQRQFFELLWINAQEVDDLTGQKKNAIPVKTNPLG